jgi:hypothetical protein
MLENGLNRGIIRRKRPVGDSRFGVNHAGINHEGAVGGGHGTLTGALRRSALKTYAQQAAVNDICLRSRFVLWQYPALEI